MKSVEYMWQYFQAGVILMWPLLACSIISLSIIFERFWFWNKLNIKKDSQIVSQILSDLKKNDFIEPKKITGLISSMIFAGIYAPPGERSKSMEVMALESLAKIRRGMGVLETIITIAPMLGIMGTILGIITSFNISRNTGINDPSVVMTGIGEALITTVAGLAITVVTIFPYNYFTSRLEEVQDLMEIYSTKLEIILK